ncbi:amino acid ABC transporter ATP-binding protein [Pseudaminobacter arsenicus]|uniref:Amino acid ABC transporter ATP-binding protein n=1 Tax=Borborobacter arsenicus TaxID=1851146 RepID=A0A432UZL1_9HYPH|nr:amino acid ABC transporter ATP-binding protein [Pseudaminobacter arsenicus]RUM95394.1 amino acid ABC transporter ATP-binding protein [Pseudaminobacter arsenicus]
MVIDVRNVSKSYGDFKVLSDCNLSVNSGEVVVVCGPSGSGKSTLIKCLNGLEAVHDGFISIAGFNLTDQHADLPSVRRTVGMVFQNFELFPHLSVLRNITIAQEKVMRRTREEATDKALALLERVGLTTQKDKYPSQLSGGQQQRIAIARALAMDPQVMLFDEPTSALDPEMIGEVLDVMVELARAGMTMVCVTHEMGFAKSVADRIVFMDKGEIVDDVAKNDFFGGNASSRAQTFLRKVISH